MNTKRTEGREGYVVDLGQGLYLSSAGKEPGGTMRLDFAYPWPTERAAERAMNRADKIVERPDARVVKVIIRVEIDPTGE